MVLLSRLVAADSVLMDVCVDDKNQLIELMLDSLVETGHVSNREDVTTALLEREAVMSTGIGRGVAIPHAQSKGMDQISVCIARLKENVAFDSIDGLPVRLVFLVVGPVQRGGFLQVLARISRLICEDKFQDRLLAAPDSRDLVKLIEEQEAL